MKRIIGLDLALTSAHKAVVMDENGQFWTPVIKVWTGPKELAGLLEQARAGAPSDLPLVAVMEPTGLAWLPVAVYLLNRQVTVYLVNSQQVADLRRFYQKHAKSDRIDSRVLAKLYLVSPEKLHPLMLAPAEVLTLQRACKQLDWLIRQTTALQNQIIALDRTIWLGGWQERLFGDPFSLAARCARGSNICALGMRQPSMHGVCSTLRRDSSWRPRSCCARPWRGGSWSSGCRGFATASSAMSRMRRPGQIAELLPRS